MSTLATANLQKTLRRKDTAEIAATVPPFPVIESPELKAQLSREQYAAVQSYRDNLIEFVQNSGKEVAEITVGFSTDRDLPDDIWFVIYLFAEMDTVMDTWDQTDVVWELWFNTQNDVMKEFINEHFATIIRRKRLRI